MILERHVNAIFYTLCEKLFNVMKFRFGAIYGYEIMSEIEFWKREHPGNYKTLKLWENQAGTMTGAMNTPGRHDKIFPDKQFE